MGSWGCSREGVLKHAGPDGEDLLFLWDGDGSHKLTNLSVNGLKIPKEWEERWKRMDEKGELKKNPLDIPNGDACESKGGVR